MNARSRLRPWLLNLTLALASTALALAGVEAAFRLAHRLAPRGKETRTRRIYTEHDPLLGWHKRPGGRVLYHRPEYRTEVAINRHGLRDREREYTKAPGTFRVLGLGDSFVEGFMVPLEHTVAQRLEASLGSPDCPVEVINGGTVGYSTDQEYLFYERDGHRYGAQVVLLFFYYNDVLFNDSSLNLGLPKPHLVPEGDGLRVANQPVPPPPPPPPPPPAPPEPAGSVALDWIGDRLESSAPHAYNRLADWGLWPPTRQVQPAAELEVYRMRPGRQVELAWESTHRILRALNQAVGRRGSRLALVYTPSRMEVHDPTWELTKLRYGWGEHRWKRGEVARRLSEIARAERIPLVDLTVALRDADSWLRPSYFPRDGHWNARGQRAAALAIRPFLAHLGWLPACAG